MLAATIPQRIGISFGRDAGGSYIHQVPDASQIGVIDGAASFTTGFPPLCFLPTSAGGLPPFGTDFNGVLSQITQWDQWQAAGAQVTYNAAFSAAIGGYPKGALLISTSATIVGNGWLSIADSNTADPDATPTNWAAFSFLGTMTCGDAKLTYKTAADSGWILANDGSIGNGSSAATTRANADCAALFAVWWNGVSNTYAQVQDSSGTPVARGANAAADFAANRRITIPKVLGRLLMIAGAGAGLTSRALGEALGAETITILQTNLPSLSLTTSIASGQGSHSHSYQIAAFPGVNGASGGAAVTLNAATTGAQTLPAMTGTTPTGGSGTSMSIMNPYAGLNLMVKL